MSYEPTQGRPRKMVFGMRLRGFQSTFLRTGICEGNLGGAHSCRRTAHLASPVLTGCERLISLPCCPVSRTPVPSNLPALLVAPLSRLRRVFSLSQARSCLDFRGLCLGAEEGEPREEYSQRLVYAAASALVRATR